MINLMLTKSDRLHVKLSYLTHPTQLNAWHPWNACQLRVYIYIYTYTQKPTASHEIKRDPRWLDTSRVLFVRTRLIFRHLDQTS